MGLIERIKTALGLDAPDREGAQTDASTQDVAVTVEHEPDTGSEDAVKGTETEEASVDTEAVEASAGEDGAGAEQTDGARSAESTADDETAADVQTIKGVGPAYAERLAEAGIETVGDLAAADPATVAEETGVAEGRVTTWIERAGE